MTISVMFTTYANNNVTCDRPIQNNLTRKQNYESKTVDVSMI